MSGVCDEKYFAAANSRGGFVNFFYDCFGDASGVSRLYVIKGGSGTGKSYFMRHAAECAEKSGGRVEYYYCSSDPASLDGVRITLSDGGRIGIIDGTPPHPWEPRLPGVVEEIINLGEFWDSSILLQSEKEIRELHRRKAEAYTRGYSYLAAAGQVADVVFGLVESFVSKAKMRSAAERISKTIPSGEGKIEISLISSIGGRGIVRFDTFERMSERIYTVEELYGVGYMMMREIYNASLGRRCDVRVSYDPLCPDRINGLYYPSAKTAFVIGKTDGESHSIGVRRFIDTAAMRELRGELRRAVNLRDSLIEGAVYSFASASSAHFAMEKIYSSAMDFDAKGKLEAEFCKRHFGV